jgi:LacI family transcriptional regulator
MVVLPHRLPRPSQEPRVEAAIEAAIADLGYRSNPLAKSMITGRTHTIGLSVLDITNPHFSSILKGANRVAHAQGYSVAHRRCFPRGTRRR